MIQKNIKEIIDYIGDDSDRPGVIDTPNRVVSSWREIYAGYVHNENTIKEMLTQFDNDEKYDEFVLLKDIEFFSTCEHHMLPFFGKAHVAYIPKDKIVGISKLSRVVNIYARRLQNQERICQQVTDALMTHLDAKGAACIMEGRHFCMCARGVNQTSATMSTSSLKGCMKESSCRMELLSLIKG